eukprot:4315611-Pyramimonas_sp.AAC.1
MIRSNMKTDRGSIIITARGCIIRVRTAIRIHSACAIATISGTSISTNSIVIVRISNIIRAGTITMDTIDRFGIRTH